MIGGRTAPTVGRMSTSKTVRSPQRRERRKAHATPETKPWLTPRRTLLVAVVAIAAVAALLIGVDVLGSGGSSKPTAVAGATAVMLDGIPQQANVLGHANAPVELIEYADLQCPYCGEFARSTLPTLIKRYVRAGKLKIEFRGLSFVGSDSEKALRAVVAAGAQNHLWNMVDLLYRNQGTENTGWVTNGLIASAASEVPALDVSRMLSDAKSGSTDAKMQVSAAQAHAVMGSQIRTPTFEIARTGQARQVLQLSSLDAAEFTPAIDRLLGQ